MSSQSLPALNCVSVFSGGMGLDIGLEQAGFTTLLACDTDPAAVATTRHNRPHLPIVDSDIRELDGEKIREITRTQHIDLLAGGPPCQSFSTAGRRLSVSDGKNGPLVFEFIRLVQDLRPRAFIMENVKGLLSAPLEWRELPYNNNGKRIDDQYGALLRAVVGGFNAIGYSSMVLELNAADYGVPQTRQRIFIIGLADGSTPSIPVATHARKPDLLHKPWVTIGEAWGNLPLDTGHCAKFSPRKLKYLKMIPPGSNWRALPEELQRESMGKAFFAKGGRTGYWRRLSLSETAPTILTEPQNASTSLCHPIEDRPISVREAARLQTFPDEWEFVGRGSEQYRLIGNAVPPLLARAVALTVRSHLLKSEAKAA